MSLRRTASVTALLALALLLATPALAAPTPDAGAAFQLRHVLAHWWADATAPLVSLFDASTHLIDPNGQPSPAPQSGNQVDPQGSPTGTDLTAPNG